jgi:hypothetical protein
MKKVVGGGRIQKKMSYNLERERKRYEKKKRELRKREEKETRKS